MKDEQRVEQTIQIKKDERSSGTYDFKMDVTHPSAFDVHADRKGKNKIVLVYPKTGMDIKHITVLLPASLLFIGKALLQNNFEVVFIDQRIDARWKEQLLQNVKSGGVLCVGVSCMTGPQILNALEISKLIKEQDQSIPVIWGGPHPSLSPQSTIVHPLVDCIAVDDGEITFVDLAKVLQNGGDLGSVHNLFFKKNGEIIMTLKSSRVDVNMFPMPAYELVDVNDYICSYTLGEKDMVMVTSRGCTHRCAFCYLEGFAQHSYRAQRPEMVVEHIKYLKEKYNIGALNIIEDNFFNNKGRAQEICELLVEANLNIKIRTTCRIDYIYHYAPEFLKLIRKAGFVELFLGVESGTDRVLNLVKKDITVEQIRVANRKLKEAGITPKYSFMVGFPSETKEEVLQTLRLMRELVEENPNAHTTPAQVFTPYPSTPFFHTATQAGWVPPTTLEGWADGHWNRVRMPWIDKAFASFLEKASFLTFFNDGKTVIEFMKPPYLVKKMCQIYSSLVRSRIKHNFYSFTPELLFFKSYLRG